ncbi:MAG: 30S ribosome-binding factor RbfA [Phycisphaerae bacterium]
MKQYRKERIASVIRNILGEAMIHRMNDPRLNPLASIARVEMSPDLQIARVFVSVPGGETQERKSLSAMAHARGYLQRLVAAELSIRHCPELRFEVDQIGKKTMATLSLIEQNRRRRGDPEPGRPGDPPAPTGPDHEPGCPPFEDPTTTGTDAIGGGEP